MASTHVRDMRVVSRDGGSAWVLRTAWVATGGFSACQPMRCCDRRAQEVRGTWDACT